MRKTKKVGAPAPADAIQEELIYGALRRERIWKIFGFVGASFGMLMGAGMMFVAMSHETPPPALVPFDPSTGMALPMANVGTISLQEREAVQASMIHSYVRDRETYNQLDNDLRIREVLRRSTGEAARSLQALWSSGHPDYPPAKYGERARMDVQIVSITPITNDRAQVRLRKRLRDASGETDGSFTVTLAFQFEPAADRELHDVWSNPFGFTVREYAITADRFE